MRIITFILLLLSTTSFAQKGQVYQIYTDKGKKVSFEKMVKSLSVKDVVLFGEFHNNSMGHWLQLEFTKEMHKKRNLVFGAEMFESDNQLGLTNYLEGKSDEEQLKKEVRLWNNYKTDYRPLVEFAKEKQLQFVATNVPRRYASLLFKQGVSALDTLGIEEKKWIAPLPFPYDGDLPGYQKMLTMFEDHKDENLPKAQAIKDATMAYFISKNRKEADLFVHYNGSYHSNNQEGIVWYLKQYAPDLNVGTITMVESDNVEEFDKNNLDLANFIIVIDANILKSF
ncbi:MAG: ChaN family lipoprotein [Flavobacteriaceae bacterium]|jgi:uncharacterized iron-regulated protein|nr:ChaN family lipoprotein [Flavobacteriaceae bacterium]